MRLVLDTNVAVSALVWGGMPYRLIEAAAAGDVELVLAMGSQQDIGIAVAADAVRRLAAA